MPSETVLAHCVDDGGPITEIARTLTQVGCEVGAQHLRQASSAAAACHLARWARSGGMHLTGHRDGPPLPAPGPVFDRAATVARAIMSLSGLLGRPVALDVAEVLFGRARLMGLTRRGQLSAGGTCRLLGADDAWFAVNLARDIDRASVPALVGRRLSGDEDPWETIASVAAHRSAQDLVETARLLSVPAARVGEATAPPVVIHDLGSPGPGRGSWRVVDLSSMWAGPLCGQILRRAGAHVTKVESRTRPDGARRGHAGFFTSLHAGKQFLAFDLESGAGRRRLEELLHDADIVIDSARPRAWERLGIQPEAIVANRPGAVWLSVTGYGRSGPEALWPAFGDDAAVAGGLVSGPASGPVFCGDAIADPLTGLVAALGVFASLAAGGGHLVEVSLAGVARAAHAREAAPAPHRVERRSDGTWAIEHQGSVAAVQWPEVA